MRKVSEVSKVSNCTHHFIIDCSNVGVCKYCGEVRDFEKLRRKAERETSKKVEGNPYGRAGKKKGRKKKEVLI